MLSVGSPPPIGGVPLSDSYEALDDCTATRDDAEKMAPLIVGCLSERGLVVPELSSECVLDGRGYPAGPRCALAYPPRDDDAVVHRNEFWKLHTNGVEIHCEPWINTYGFPVFEHAVCPKCGHRAGDEFLDEVGAAVEAFSVSAEVPIISCLECGVKSLLHDWACDPPLGFVNLAIVFWNWPPFDDEDWKLDVPALLEGKLGRLLVRTHGHV
jgi:hypothetical protein